MNQKELIRLLCSDTGIKYEDVRRILRKMTRYIGVAIENNDPINLGFGTLDIKLRGAKEVQNFKTGERFMLPILYKLVYTPSSYIKRSLIKKNATITNECIEGSNVETRKPVKTK